MATITTAAAQQPNSSSSSRRPWILLDADGYTGKCPNGTTAEHLTSTKKPIKVSIRPDDPPAPSRLFVQGCLRMVELEVDIDGPPFLDPETGRLKFGIHDWELSTYTNRKISGAWEDWHLDCTAKASHIDIDEAMQWQLLQSGLLLHAKQQGRERKLKNLHTSQPVLGLDDNGAVYLLTKVKFMESRAWVLSVDIKGKKNTITGRVQH